MIELAQARDLLLRAVETQGRDFVYNPGGNGYCSYTPQDERQGDPRSKTGCLIGVALDLAEETRHHGIDGDVLQLMASFSGLMTEVAGLYFQKAQKVQDAGFSWGAAYDAAEAFLTEEGDGS